MDKKVVDQLRVAIILCTYNDTKNYLSQQLESIRQQTYQNITVYIFDDSTNEIIKNQIANLKSHNKLKIIYRKGMKRGFVANFINGICQVRNFDYYFLCDQDDVWLRDKVNIALTYALKLNLNKDIPFLYGCRTIGVDKNLKFITYSHLSKKKLSFNNALIQNFAGGNTFCFNKSLHKIIMKYGIVDVPFHDWWIYILNTAHNGRTIYDVNAHMLYRQDNNIVGLDYQIKKRIKNFLKKLFFNQLRNNINIHVDILLAKKEIIKNKEIYVKLKFLRERFKYSYFIRVVKIIKFNFYTHSSLGNFLLLILIIFNKV